MLETQFDLLAIGNAIVDVIAPVTSEFLSNEGMTKGMMHLIDNDQANNLFEKMPGTKRQVSGGSAANTAVGVASLNGRASFVGKVSDDVLGNFFANDLNVMGVNYQTEKLIEGVKTARCLIMVTPDGERTMHTYLGACHHLTENDICEDQIAAATVTYMEGFLWDPPEAKKAFRLASQYAHKHGRMVGFSLSDALCVQRYRDEFINLIQSGTIDYVLANIHEIKALYQTDDLQIIVSRLKTDVDLAVITMGADGALAVSKREEVHVSAYPVHQVIDATGAGDLFASGFLLGLARKEPMASCLRTGCMVASEIISHVGARPEIMLSKFIDELSRKTLHG